MGIGGLTTFINSNSKQYLEEYNLRDTYLVIDGFNIASHLYKWHCTRNDCFGGDYDKYAKVVHGFFKLLETCNIVPLMIFDGGYETKKEKTIYSRFKNKIQMASHLNSVTQGGVTMFPLFLKDLFIDIVLKLRIKTVQCDLEADYEMACVARYLNCPVLSYDSDFYIFDVLYIPFSTFEMTAHKMKNSSVPCYFIRCQIYKIDKFLESVGGLNKKNLPLMATLLGNDYIKMSVFHQFYSELKLPINKQGKSTRQAKILGVIKWLQHESYDSAVYKILNKINMNDRRLVEEQIKISTETYLNYNSEVLQYLNVSVLHEQIKKSCSVATEAEEYLQDEIVETNGEATSVSGVTEEINPKLMLKQNINIPNWFKETFRRCEYPQTFMDILNHNTYISVPQVEDYANKCSHNISFPILSAIHYILLSGSNKNLTCIVRADCKSGMSKPKIPLFHHPLPKLPDIVLLTQGESKTILFNILDITINGDLNELLDMLPSTWQLYFISIIYWIKNANPNVKHSHLYSLILCLFVLYKIDPQVGFYRSTFKFRSKFSSTIDSLVKNSQSSDLEFKDSLNKISYEECLLSFKELIEYFQMNEKMRYYVKLFDVKILDCFAQFQSCLMHIKYLNRLLNNPFCNFIISEFYDGTFLFNMCLNLSKRTNIETYLCQTLLKFAPNVFNCTRRISEMLIRIIPDSVNGTKIKRRRKKKKAASTDANERDCTNHESNEENVIDVNNRFSLLNIVK